MTFDGEAVEGQPFTTDIWHDSIGGDRSSCCFALAETFVALLVALLLPADLVRSRSSRRGLDTPAELERTNRR